MSDAGTSDKNAARARWPWVVLVVGGLMLVALAAYAPPLMRVRRESLAAAAIAGLGGRVEWSRTEPPVHLRPLAPLPWDLARRGRLVDLASMAADDTSLMHVRAFGAVEWLDLSGTKVTDAGLAVLGDLHRIRWLDLSETDVTDTGLAFLAELPDLQYLDLRGTRATTTAAAAIRKSRPAVQVQH